MIWVTVGEDINERDYYIPDELEQDLIDWLEWAVKQGERDKKYEEAQND